MRSLALAVAVAAPAAANGSSITAVQKVIQLLNDMRTKCQQDMNDEQVEFSKFGQFCKGETANKKKAIASAEELMEELSTGIEKLGSDCDQLADEIDQLQQDTTTAEAQLKEQTLQRDKDKASNAESIQDLAESVDALDRAVKTLEARSGDVKQAGAALLQISTMTDIPDSVQRSIAAFIEMSADGPQANFNDGGEAQLSIEAPEANAYESQSGGILDLLKKLKKEFTEKKSEAEKEEMNSQGAFNMIAQDLHDQVEANTKDVSDKSETKEGKTEQKADDSKRLESTTGDHAEDSETLKQLDTECFEKKDSFDEKQQLRKEEIVAIGKAMEIMQSGDVAGNAEEHLPTFIQKSTALAQLRSKSSSPEDNNLQVVKFIKSEGRRLQSTTLSMLAEKMASDPFAKVKNLIANLITKLLKEANEESTQKGFCDKEVGTNKITRTKLSETIDDLTAANEEHQAKIADITKTVADLTQELSDLRSAMSEATALRTEEKAKNKATIADSKAAQAGVKAAMAVLKDFYTKAATATAFIQISAKTQGDFDVVNRPRMGTAEWDALANPNYQGSTDKGHKEGDQTFGETYSGNQDAGGGVLAMMEVIMSDFKSVEADTEAAEAEASKSYDDFMATSKRSVLVKDKESEMLTADRVDTQSQLVTDTKDMKSNQDQLLAAERYYDKLKPSCVDSGVSYDERVQAREAEIQSLQEALEMLSSGDLNVVD